MKAILLHMHRYHLLTVKLYLSQIKSGCYFTPLETAYLHTSQHNTKQHNLMSYFPGDVLMFGWRTSHNLMQESSVLCYWHVPGRLPPIAIMAFTSSSFLWANPLSAISVCFTCSWPGTRCLFNLLAVWRKWQVAAVLWAHSLFPGWHRLACPGG